MAARATHARPGDTGRMQIRSLGDAEESRGVHVLRKPSRSVQKEEERTRRVRFTGTSHVCKYTVERRTIEYLKEKMLSRGVWSPETTQNAEIGHPKPLGKKPKKSLKQKNLNRPSTGCLAGMG